MNVIVLLVVITLIILSSAALHGWHTARKRSERLSADRRLLRHALRGIVNHACDNDPYTSRTAKNALEETDDIK